MKNNTDKERWIAEIMNTAGAIPNVNPSPDLYEKIQARLTTKPVQKTIPIPVTKWVAAAVLLLAVNIGSFVYYINNHNRHAYTGQDNPFTTAMQTTDTYNY